MFAAEQEDGYTQLIEGIEIKTLVYGEKTLTAKFRLARGSVLPHHSHPHEQTGYLIAGKMRFVVADEVHLALPGSSWCIAGGEEHSAEVLEDSVVIEVFSPMREEYLPERLQRKS
ncbi:MAG: cupin domain-containing protein [Desulfopila sp.]|jgi:quercetin dioxygenase-like cupin family protein|nr:cupin domain-containing protein [Desulfopila sp.]